MDKNRKKQVKRYVAWGVAVVLVVLLAVMPLLAAQEVEEDGPHASILTARTERRDITRKIIGGGMLASAEKKNLTIPEEVKLVEYLVGNGDVVKQGDPIALVDRVSVMTAITKVQESLDYLAKEIQSTRNDVVEETVTSRVSGVVKYIFAQVDDDVQDVMLEYGALAVLSLDSLMAVKLECDISLAAGQTVGVVLEDGTQVEGIVDSNLDGILVVTVEDDNYTPGQQVTVNTEDGSRIGAGSLYIYSPWTAHGYSGIVSDIRVKVGQKVSVGQTLLRLKETGQTAEYQELINQYHEYEDMMKDLFQMYSTQSVTAPCDGIVSGVDTDGAFLLSTDGDWTLSLLTEPSQQQTAYWGFAAQVLSVQENGLELMAEPAARVIADFADVSVDASAMTRSWNYTGSTRVYICTDNGILAEAGYARQGDVLFFVGDETEIHWIIRVDGTGVKNTTVQRGFQGAVLSRLSTEAPYLGYPAQVIEVLEEGKVRVMQTAYPIEIESLDALPEIPMGDLSAPWDLSLSDVGVGGLIWTIIDTATEEQQIIVVDAGNLEPEDKEEPPTTPTLPGFGGMGDLESLLGGLLGGFGGFGGGGSFGGFGGFGGGAMGGTVEEEESPTYTLETHTIATVTSQETITLDITVDEAEILLLSVGQKAELMVSPLAGEVFEATITEISNNGVNSGGRTKFTVTVSTQKHSDMYPGMTGSLAVTINTVEDALVLPVAALVDQGAKTVVYTGYDPETETLLNPVEVTTGVSDGEYVEVLGIEEGAEVYYAYYDTLVLSDTPENDIMFR